METKRVFRVSRSKSVSGRDRRDPVRGRLAPARRRPEARPPGAGRKAAPDDGLKARIVAAARRLFLSSGFVRVTADDIARELGISKATLYRVFPGKEAVLQAVARDLMNDILQAAEKAFFDDRLSFLERAAAFTGAVGERFAAISPLFLDDVRRSAPNVWREIEAFRREKILKNFNLLMDCGRREGFVRDDIDPELSLRMFLSLVQGFVTPEAILSSGKRPAEVLETLLEIFFRGMLTEMGRSGLPAGLLSSARPAKEAE
jgi:AcrR family transcriptional regulator